MEVYPHSAKTYLREAREALDRLNNGRDSDDIHRALITFLNATKHTVHQLQTDFKNKLVNFDEWYEPQRKILENDKICNFFWTLRNRVIKEGEDVLKMKSLSITPISGQKILHIQGTVKIGPSVGVLQRIKKGDIFELQPRKDIQGLKTEWEFIDYPDINPVSLCEKYLKILDQVLDSFIEKFSL